MLGGTCLSEVLEKLQATLDSGDDCNNDHNNDHNNDPDDGSEDGQDLDADEDDDQAGATDDPPALSEVTLAWNRGQDYSLFHLFQCF